MRDAANRNTAPEMCRGDCCGGMQKMSDHDDNAENAAVYKITAADAAAQDVNVKVTPLSML